LTSKHYCIVFVVIYGQKMKSNKTKQ